MAERLCGGVSIADVAPRDGLQNVEAFVPTAGKVALVEEILQAGVREIQIGSFVSPKAVPQFADMAVLAKELVGRFGAESFCALIANEQGMDAALYGGLGKVAFVLSVSEAHNLQNVGQPRAASVATLTRLSKRLASGLPLTLRVDVATVFGCPFVGRIPTDEVLRCLHQFVPYGINTVTLCDTMGMANPRLVEEVVSACRKEFPRLSLRLHFHNTRGLALANILRGYEIGIRDFDASLGGLGGCPFAPGASGNAATEDVVFMLEAMGISTGVDLERLFAATRFLRQLLPEVPITSAVFHADGGEAKKEGKC